MKTTPECWQALMDGQTLTNGYSNVRLNEEDELVYANGSPATWAFSKPEDWSIYTPPKWYDNIPEGGVLCRVLDSRDNLLTTAVIIEYVEGDEFPFKAVYDDATACLRSVDPLTKQEIQQLLDNAPEGEGE